MPFHCFQGTLNLNYNCRHHQVSSSNSMNIMEKNSSIFTIYTLIFPARHNFEAFFNLTYKIFQHHKYISLSSGPSQKNFRCS